MVPTELEGNQQSPALSEVSRRGRVLQCCCRDTFDSETEAVLVAKWLELQGARSTHQSHGKQDDAAQQAEHAVNGNAYEAKWNQKDPHESCGAPVSHSVKIVTYGDSGTVRPPPNGLVRLVESD